MFDVVVFESLDMLAEFGVISVFSVVEWNDAVCARRAAKPRDEKVSLL